MSKNVVVVDDDPMIRFLVAEFLKAHGYEVTALESGKDCIEHLGHSSADLIIVDLQMPEMTGVDVVRAMRDSPALNSIPVMMLTANIQDGQSDINALATCYIEKPFDMNDFLKSVRGLLP